MMFIIVSLVLISLSNINALQCYDCYYNKPESDNSILKTFFSGLNTLSSDYCKLEKPSDIYDINTRTCAPETGKVSRCAVVNGKVTAKVLGTIYLVFNTISRKCIAVDAAAPDYTVGCHTNPPPSGALEKILDMIPGLTHIQFEGQSCYYDHLTSGVVRSSINVVYLFLATCFAVLFTVYT